MAEEININVTVHDVEGFVVRPGDCLVVNVPDDSWDQEKANTLVEALKEYFPGVRVLALMGDVTLAKISHKNYEIIVGDEGGAMADSGSQGYVDLSEKVITADMLEEGHIQAKNLLVQSVSEEFDVPVEMLTDSSTYENAAQEKERARQETYNPEGKEEVIHYAPLDRDVQTRCCHKSVVVLPKYHRLTMEKEAVTCPELKK